MWSPFAWHDHQMTSREALQLQASTFHFLPAARHFRLPAPPQAQVMTR